MPSPTRLTGTPGVGEGFGGFLRGEFGGPEGGLGVREGFGTPGGLFWPLLERIMGLGLGWGFWGPRGTVLAPFR